MRLGIFAKTFARCSLGETLDAVKAHGIVCVQFNISCAGLPTMPEEIPAELADRIRGEMDRRELMMAAVSGTFNMIHPRREKRRAGLRKLAVLAGAPRDRRVSRLLSFPVVGRNVHSCGYGAHPPPSVCSPTSLPHTPTGGRGVERGWCQVR
jgi:sugar phosphate isomerase/epimerase